jgi:hypothetical protein
MFKLLNDPTQQPADHQACFRLARLGDETWHAGAQWVGSWMTRNLRMWQDPDRISQASGRS